MEPWRGWCVITKRAPRADGHRVGGREGRAGEERAAGQEGTLCSGPVTLEVLLRLQMGVVSGSGVSECRCWERSGLDV